MIDWFKRIYFHKKLTVSYLLRNITWVRLEIDPNNLDWLRSLINSNPIRIGQESFGYNSNGHFSFELHTGSSSTLVYWNMVHCTGAAHWNTSYCTGSAPTLNWEYNPLLCGTPFYPMRDNVTGNSFKNHRKKTAHVWPLVSQDNANYEKWPIYFFRAVLRSMTGSYCSCGKLPPGENGC